MKHPNFTSKFQLPNKNQPQQQRKIFMSVWKPAKIW